MAEMEILEIEETTNPNKDSKVLINENGVFKQAEIDNLLGNSDTISNVNTSIKNQIESGFLGKNLFNIDTCINGILSLSDGTRAYNTTWLTSDFIKVKPNSKITFSCNNTTDNYLVRFCEYTADKSFLGNGQANLLGVDGNNTKILTTNSTTEYIKISLGFNNKETTVESYKASGNYIQIEQGEVATDYVPYVYPNTEIGTIKNTLVSKIGFIDTSNVIVQNTTVTSNTEYTATQDCYFIIVASQTTDKNDWVGVKLEINNHMIWEILTKTAKDGCVYNFPLKKGQTINIKQDGSGMVDNVTYKVLGMI